MYIKHINTRGSANEMKHIGQQKNDFDFTGMIVVLVLCIVTVVLYFEWLDVLRSPLFALGVSTLFLMIAFRDTTFSHKSVKLLHEIDVYALILSMLLFFVVFMIYLDNWTIVRSAWFPIICGAIFILLTTIDAFTEIFREHTTEKHINMVAIVGGEIMIVYGISLHYHMLDLIWAPMFPGLAALSLYTMSIGAKAQSMIDRFVAHKEAKRSISFVSTDNMDFELPFEVYSVNDFVQPVTRRHHSSTSHPSEPVSTNVVQAKRDNPPNEATTTGDPHDFIEMLENAKKLRAMIVRQRAV